VHVVESLLHGKGTRRVQLVRRDGLDVSALYGRRGGVLGADRRDASRVNQQGTAGHAAVCAGVAPSAPSHAHGACWGALACPAVSQKSTATYSGPRTRRDCQPPAAPAPAKTLHSNGRTGHGARPAGAAVAFFPSISASWRYSVSAYVESCRGSYPSIRKRSTSLPRTAGFSAGGRRRARALAQRLFEPGSATPGLQTRLPKRRSRQLR